MYLFILVDNSTSDNSNSNTGIIIGVVASISVIIVVLIAIMLVVLLVRRKRRRSQQTVKMFTKAVNNHESNLSLRYYTTTQPCTFICNLECLVRRIGNFAFGH